jgi:hypothetical protein
MIIWKNQIDAAKILQLRERQWINPLFTEAIVPPGQTVETPLPLSTIGAFFVLWMTGQFTTLRVKAGLALQDLGVNNLRMKISAGASTRTIFNSFTPMNLLFTPGRVRTDPADPGLITGGAALADADQGPIPNQLFNPVDFQFPFSNNDTITISVQNTADAITGWSNRWGICFYGVRIFNIPGTNLKMALPPKK